MSPWMTAEEVRAISAETGIPFLALMDADAKEQRGMSQRKRIVQKLRRYGLIVLAMQVERGER